MASKAYTMPDLRDDGATMLLESFEFSKRGAKGGDGCSSPPDTYLVDINLTTIDHPEEEKGIWDSPEKRTTRRFTAGLNAGRRAQKSVEVETYGIPLPAYAGPDGVSFTRIDACCNNGGQQTVRRRASAGKGDLEVRVPLAIRLRGQKGNRI
jgi:hypothetical protein